EDGIRDLIVTGVQTCALPICLESIDMVLRSDTVREQIRPIIERVRAELARKNEALMTWEPIPLTVFAGALPREIRSAWVFVLREIGRASCRERVLVPVVGGVG